MPKYVVSSTLAELSSNNSHLLDGDMPTAVADLRDQIARVMLVTGSRRLAQPLLPHDLVDKLRLMLFPIVLGSGKRPFADDPANYTPKLADCKELGSSTVIVTYAAGCAD